ncbi:MAG: M24 family metallopeptidase [Burkholderiales bacterium]|nr:M24 family metallopeptidase [Burkholderiales bacterium]
MSNIDIENPLNLQPRLLALMQQEYPRFSTAEYVRRQQALAAAMQEAGADHLIVITEGRSGNATQWLTGWPGSVEAFVVFRPGEKLWMSVEWVNHFPLAKKMCDHMDVVWGEHRGTEKMIAELKRRGARRVGIIGPLRVAKYRALEQHFEMVSLDAKYTRLRMIKSEEELDWLRIGAAMSDAGLRALVAECRPGLSERELGAIVESAYIKLGGATMIHYIGVTPMAQPHIFVPPQHHSPRKVQKGDVVFCELSAFWWDYAGQVLRTFTVDAEPTQRYADLHAAAEATFDAVTGVFRHGAAMQDILDATGLIEQRGYTVCDDLVHGFGGGYFQPIIGTKSRMAGTLPAMTLEENMTVVVQPNPVTTEADESKRAGVQVGELVRITRDGFERLHRAPRGLFRAGQRI